MSDKKLVQYKAYIDKESGSIVCNTLNASNNINLAGQLNLNDMILADPGNGFQLYSNDAQGYPTINFYSGKPGTGILQYSIGVFNDIWYVIPNGGSQALQVSSDMSVNMPYSVSVCDGNGTFTCDGEATFNSTLTANSANVSTTLTANSASISTTLTAQQVICSPSIQGAALHIYGDADYSAELAFMTGTDKLFEIGTTTANVVSTTGNFFFIYNNQNSTYSMQIITGSPQTINLNGDVNVYGGLGISTNITVNNTLTANNIVATGLQLNVTGSNPQGIYINGTSSSGDATQIFFQEEGTTHWQLGPNYTSGNPPDFWLFNNVGNYNTLQIHANTPLIDINSSINVSGSATLSGTLTAATINVTAINPNNTVVSYSGNVTGTAYLSQPFTGSSYKKVIITFVGYQTSDTVVTFTFPVAFSSTDTIYATYDPQEFAPTLNTTDAILETSTTTTYYTMLVIEGW